MLAKIMLAERFAPAVYDVIARGSASTGISKELVAVEALVAGEDADGRRQSVQRHRKGVEEGDLVGEWQDLEWAKKWASIEPRLSEEGLATVSVCDAGQPGPIRRDGVVGRS